MLKIDLLPRHFAIARTNKIVIALFIILLIAVMAGWGFAYMMVRGQISATQAKLDEVEPIAKKTEQTEQEIAQKQGELAPIAAKVDFVAEADQSGAQYWDRFHDIVAWIPAFAQITQFSITNPANVNFDAIVGDTTEAARFVLNIIQCPALSNVSISGLPAGVSIEGVGGAAGFTPMGGAMGPGMEPGMEAGMEPGMEAGMPGGPGMAPMGGGAQPTASGEIHLSITATLTEPVSEPVPGGGGAAAGGMPGGMPGMPGMEPGMEPGMPGPEGAPPGGEMPPEAPDEEPSPEEM